MFFTPKLMKKTFLQRLPISNEQFCTLVYTQVFCLKKDSLFIIKFIEYLRLSLGEILGLEPEKIYPTDTWRYLYDVGRSYDWDLYEIVLRMEDELMIEISSEDVPFPSQKMEIGEWVAEFISNYCSSVAN
jgi:hypothetical protein